MLWNDTLHTKYLQICEPLPQQDNAEIPVLDGDVLLDCHFRFLPNFEDPFAGGVLEDWHLGRSHGPRTGYSRVRAILVVKLLVAGA